MTDFDSDNVRRGVCRVSTAVGRHANEPGVSECLKENMPSIIGKLSAYWSLSEANSNALRPVLCAILNLDFARTGILYIIDDNGVIKRETIRCSNCVEAIFKAFLEGDGV